MRKLIYIVVVLGVLLGAAIAYLVVTTPTTAHSVHFPLSPSHRQLLDHVPASAEAFALVPSAAQLQGKLLANRVTNNAVSQWTTEHELPHPWMLGGADVVIWKAGKSNSYAIRLDRFRALFVRGWLLMASNADARWEGSTLIMHDPVPGAPSRDLDALLQLATGLPQSDVFVVQREGGRGAFPPMGRPAATAITVTANQIELTSRAATDDIREQREIRPSFPRGAMLAAAFATPPRILGDLNRLLGARIDALVDEGGSLALYDVDTGTLLPRPKGVLVMPADDRAREQLKDAEKIIALVGEVRDLNGKEIVLSFDRSSMGLYLKDQKEPGQFPATQWALRLDPKKLVPVLRKAGDSPGLRFASPRLHRGARDLRRWIDALQGAETVEAAASVAGGVEVLRVRVVSK